MLKKSTRYQSNKLIYIKIVVVVCVICCLVLLIRDNSAESEYVSDVCNAVKNMDFTIREPQLDITAEEDRLYKKAYLQVLKNEMPILEWEKQYYKDLWRAGIEYEDLLERKNDDRFPYLFYYDDLDGDGKPELGINQGCLYLFDYEIGDKGVRVLYCQESCYLGSILGSGQIWYHDGLHADVIRDRYVFLNKDNEWEEYALNLEHGINPLHEYYLVGTSQYEQTDVGEKTGIRSQNLFLRQQNTKFPQRPLRKYLVKCWKEADRL